MFECCVLFHDEAILVCDGSGFWIRVFQDNNFFLLYNTSLFFYNTPYLLFLFHKSHNIIADTGWNLVLQLQLQLQLQLKNHNLIASSNAQICYRPPTSQNANEERLEVVLTSSFKDQCEGSEFERCVERKGCTNTDASTGTDACSACTNARIFDDTNASSGINASYRTIELTSSSSATTPPSFCAPRSSLCTPSPSLLIFPPTPSPSA